MKKIIALCVLFLSYSNFHAQAPNPVTWTTAYKAISATEGEISITATIEKNWHTYSQSVVADGPIPTSFVFTPNKQYQLIDKTTESKAEEEYVEAFGAKVAQFSNKAEFKQKIKITGKGGFMISIKVEYMCCDNKMCLPPKTLDLTVKIQ